MPSNDEGFEPVDEYAMDQYFSNKQTAIVLMWCTDICFRNVVNDTFGPLLLLYFGVIIFTLCTGLYCVSNEESFEGLIRGFAGEIGWFFQFMVSYCIPVQNLIDEVEKAPFSLYQSNWYENRKHYKDVLILLGKSKQKFYYSAAGVRHIDHLSGLAALKTVVSYWGFLRAVGGRR